MQRAGKKGIPYKVQPLWKEPGIHVLHDVEQFIAKCPSQSSTCRDANNRPTVYKSCGLAADGVSQHQGGDPIALLHCVNVGEIRG